VPRGAIRSGVLGFALNRLKVIDPSTFEDASKNQVLEGQGMFEVLGEALIVKVVEDGR
jgi:hypothetical protein